MNQKKDNNEPMSSAIEAVRNGLSQRRAAAQFGVKLMTLNDRLMGRHGPSLGKKTKLSATIKNLLVELFIFMSDIGFSLTKSEFLFVVNNYLKESESFDLFKDCEPSTQWHYGLASKIVDQLDRDVQLAINLESELVKKKCDNCECVFENETIDKKINWISCQNCDSWFCSSCIFTNMPNFDITDDFFCNNCK